jgi:hypothetical protein
MNTHLDEEQITAAVAGLDLGEATEEHLAACLSCRQQVAAFKDLISTRGEQMAAEAPDWDRQRAEILLRLPADPARRSVTGRRWLRPLIAAAAVVVVVVGLDLLWSPAPAGDPVVELEVPIEQILAEVDAVLSDDSLPGFESIDPGVDDLASIFENGAS